MLLEREADQSRDFDITTRQLPVCSRFGKGEGGRRIEYGGGNIWQQQRFFAGEDTPTAAVEKLLVCIRTSQAETYIHTNTHLLYDV